MKTIPCLQIMLQVCEGLFNIAAAVGVHSPTEITSDHIIYRQLDGTTTSIQDYKLKLIS